MLDIENIQSLTDFQRNARAEIQRIKKTGRPAILTVNGRAEVVVQDAKSYRRMLDEMKEFEHSKRLQCAAADIKAGRYRDAEEVLDELQIRYFGKIISPRKKRKNP